VGGGRRSVRGLVATFLSVPQVISTTVFPFFPPRSTTSFLRCFLLHSSFFGNSFLRFLCIVRYTVTGSDSWRFRRLLYVPGRSQLDLPSPFPPFPLFFFQKRGATLFSVRSRLNQACSPLLLSHTPSSAYPHRARPLRNSLSNR